MSTIFSLFLDSECTQTSCVPAAGDVDPSLFVDFKRSITWDIKVPERTVIALDFPGAGLKEISGAESCKDGYQYSVSTTKGDGSVKENKFCRGGTVSHLDLPGATTVTVQVPKEGEVEQKVFSVKATPRGKRRFQIFVHTHITQFICIVPNHNRLYHYYTTTLPLLYVHFYYTHLLVYGSDKKERKKENEL